jgi:hypothetical protein
MKTARQVRAFTKQLHILTEEIVMASPKKHGMVTAVFHDRFSADSAWKWLVARGYSNDDITLLMSESTKTNYYSDEHEMVTASSHAAEGMAAGGAIGTAVGAAAGAIVAIGTSLLIPGLGIVVAGPIAAALAGGGAGAVTGGVIGGLVGLGIPESNAKAYEHALRDGGVAIGVVPHSSQEATAIKRKFEELKGDNIITL